jgi:hypothetical protein
VFVVVALMGGVTTTVMDVVHVVAVRDGDMPTPLGMHVVMPLMNAVLADLTFVVVAIVGFVQVSFVDIVDMVAVRDGDMPTPLTMGVVMANVLFVRRCHLGPSSRSRRESRFSSRYNPILGDANIFIHCIFDGGERSDLPDYQHQAHSGATVPESHRVPCTAIPKKRNTPETARQAGSVYITQWSSRVRPRDGDTHRATSKSTGVRSIWDEITAIWASAVSSGASATAAIELLASDPRVGSRRAKRSLNVATARDASRPIRRSAPVLT